MKDMHPDREDTYTQAYILTSKHTHTHTHTHTQSFTDRHNLYTHTHAHTHTHILKEESYISSFYMK